MCYCHEVLSLKSNAQDGLLNLNLVICRNILKVSTNIAIIFVTFKETAMNTKLKPSVSLRRATGLSGGGIRGRK
jgi:hypothetical protein